jgi:hypothetical protein
VCVWFVEGGVGGHGGGDEGSGGAPQVGGGEFRTQCTERRFVLMRGGGVRARSGHVPLERRERVH